MVDMLRISPISNKTNLYCQENKGYLSSDRFDLDPEQTVKIKDNLSKIVKMDKYTKNGPIEYVQFETTWKDVSKNLISLLENGERTSMKVIINKSGHSSPAIFSKNDDGDYALVFLRDEDMSSVNMGKDVTISMPQLKQSYQGRSSSMCHSSALFMLAKMTPVQVEECSSLRNGEVPTDPNLYKYSTSQSHLKEINVNFDGAVDTKRGSRGFGDYFKENVKFSKSDQSDLGGYTKVLKKTLTLLRFLGQQKGSGSEIKTIDLSKKSSSSGLAARRGMLKKLNV